MYSKLKEIKKFTAKEEVDIIIGSPKFKLENLPIYYYGNGILIAYTPHRFKMEGESRVKYGEEGNYAVSFYHFSDVEMLKEQCGLDFFDDDNMKISTSAVIDGDITYGKTFKEVQNMGLKNKYVNCYMEGENRRLVEGKVKVINLFIIYGTYTLFFRGKSKKNKVSGFKYTLSE